MMGRRPRMTFKQLERAIRMFTAGMSEREVARHFQRHESTISRLLNRFQRTGNVADRPRSSRQRKTKPREDRFSRLHLNEIDFFLVESISFAEECNCHKGLRKDSQEEATRRSIESVPSLCWHSADVATP